MTRLSRQSQPDLLLAKLEMRLLPIPHAEVEVCIEAAALMALVGVVYTFIALLWVWK